jgi:2-polyprenyl-3-methyl-5-hydroxy-6-metoxy-1,4-benzoquinol methylase
MSVGTSHPESRIWIIDKIQESGVQRILDIGAGSGTYSDALSDAGISVDIDAVEVWKPYIDEFNLQDKYGRVYEEDVRNHNDFNYDLIIFGDILEHMSKEEALAVWKKVSEQAKNAIIAIPIIHYEQHAINDNPYEEHIKDDWSHEEVLDSFHGIVDWWQGNIVGAYWAEF